MESAQPRPSSRRPRTPPMAVDVTAFGYSENIPINNLHREKVIPTQTTAHIVDLFGVAMPQGSPSDEASFSGSSHAHFADLKKLKEEPERGYDEMLRKREAEPMVPRQTAANMVYDTAAEDIATTGEAHLSGRRKRFRITRGKGLEYSSTHHRKTSSNSKSIPDLWKAEYSSFLLHTPSSNSVFGSGSKDLEYSSFLLRPLSFNSDGLWSKGEDVMDLDEAENLKADLEHSSDHLYAPSSNSVSLDGPRSNAVVRGVKYYEIPGTLNDVSVNALPDSGSGIDAVSENFAKRHFPDFIPNGTAPIRLPGGFQAKSIGRVVGDFKFKGEGRVYQREFHVLRNSMYDLVLGKAFLNRTETLTKHFHRIIEKIRQGLWVGKRLFLLDEPSQDGLPCSLNGAEAWALPDTGSDVMAVSASFARRHNFHVHREEMYRNPLRLIDGTTIWTDGMVCDADLQFSLTRTIPSKTSASFICDIHVIEDLPCDVVLSNEFIFQNQIYSRFAEFFCPDSSETSELERSVLYLELEKKAFSWKRVKEALSRMRGSSSAQGNVGADLQSQGPHQGPQQCPQHSWDERRRIEGKRRIDALNEMLMLSGERLSQHKQSELEMQAAWNRDNPKPDPSGHLSSSSGTAASGQGQVSDTVGAITNTHLVGQGSGGTQGLLSLPVTHVDEGVSGEVNT